MYLFLDMWENTRSLMIWGGKRRTLDEGCNVRSRREHLCTVKWLLCSSSISLHHIYFPTLSWWMRVLQLNVNSTAIRDLTHLCLHITAILNDTLCTSRFTPTGGVHAATPASAPKPSASLTSGWLHSCLPWGEVPLCMLYVYKQLITNLQNLSFIISSINPQQQIH